MKRLFNWQQVKNQQHKFRDWEKLKKKLDKLKKIGKKIVFTNGIFDVSHIGYLELLLGAKSLGDILVVAINSDDSVKKIKGPSKPINHEMDRALLIWALKPVDYVIIFDQTTPEAIIDFLKPDIHAKGGDYQIEKMPEAKVVRSYGGEVVLIPRTTGRSVSAIIDKILTTKPVKRKMKGSFVT